MRVFPMLLLCLFCFPPAHGSPALAADSAHQEADAAARREQQELRERAKALSAQRHTAEALLDKQEQVLRTLRRQIEALRRSRAAPSS